MNPEKSIVAAYCRVSTLEQKRRGYGIDIQVRDVTFLRRAGDFLLIGSIWIEPRAGSRRTAGSCGSCGGTAGQAESARSSFPPSTAAQEMSVLPRTSDS